MGISFHIKGSDGLVDCGIEAFHACEGLVGKMMDFEITPNAFDVIEFRGIFRKPLDGEPMGAGGERCPCGFARVDRTIIEHDDNRLRAGTGLEAVEPVKDFQKYDEVSATFGCRGRYNQFALAQSNAPIMATFFDWPGASMRRSAPRFAQARAR